MLVTGISLSVRDGMSVWVLSGGFDWVSFPFFYLLEELVQGSAIFWPYLHLERTSLIVARTVFYVRDGVSVCMLSGVFSLYGVG